MLLYQRECSPTPATHESFCSTRPSASASPYTVYSRDPPVWRVSAAAALIELGSFDAAAERVHVTPSAISQRIKALDQRVGQVRVVREKPCKPRPARS